MKFKTVFQLDSFLLFITILFSQTNKITEVQNNLTQTKNIIFIDSTLNKYTIADRMAFYKVPSVSIAVINNGKIAWAKAYGYKDMETKKATDTNTLYQVASITKSETI